ncbi:hypothetical protein HPS54_10940 [Prevotella sp. PCHR]|uniref:Uncharacterized protein n=1 Tax=Xylanibacter caecicola TaxID=2736294 RepID=A0ABX2B6K9_9BACT|nr:MULTISPECIES: hypothetical protein [Xylanibacter]NPE26017.1 hypothetical protein [Xylanibacter caecicola]
MKRFLFLLFPVLLTGNVFADNGQQTGQRSDRKIIEITKIVKLSVEQEKAIREAYDRYNEKIDSSLYDIKDAVVAARMKYEAGKAFNEALMNTLTEPQRNRYIRVTSTPEIEVKAQYKTDLLSETGEYTDAELKEKKTAIFNYLMAEKIVYVRDKYNIKKQKENIRRLKQVQPVSLRESEIREKQKAQGRFVNGKVRW